MSEQEEVKKEDAETVATATKTEVPASVPRQAAVPVVEQGGGEAQGEQPQPAKRIRTKSGKYIPVGIVHVRASFNNTHVSITDPSGALLAWSNAGRCAFKGSRKSTAFAATTVAQDAARQVLAHGMHEVEVRVQGPGAGRESAIRAIQSAGINVTSIKDVTPIPHNGCRAPKRRRV